MLSMNIGVNNPIPPNRAQRRLINAVALKCRGRVMPDGTLVVWSKYNADKVLAERKRRLRLAMATGRF